MVLISIGVLHLLPDFVLLETLGAHPLDNPQICFDWPLCASSVEKRVDSHSAGGNLLGC